MVNDKIISLEFERTLKTSFEFRTYIKRFKVRGEDIWMPMIGLYEKSRNILIANTYYEMNLFNFNSIGGRGSSPSTLKKKAYAVEAFLNDLLNYTRCSSLQDVSVNDIANFSERYRKIKEGEWRDQDGWLRDIRTVYEFLVSYAEQHPLLEFKFDRSSLFSLQKRKNYYGEWRESYEINQLGVHRPKKKEKKNRLLPYGYMALLIECAKADDPMLALMIAAQAYSGIREGEVVNLTVGRIKPKYGGFGRLSGYRIVLSEGLAPFVKEREGKTPFGYIKREVDREIYEGELSGIGFVDDFGVLYDEHITRLKAMGGDTSPNAPLFLDKDGKAMSVFCYTERLKKLFYESFLPNLIRIVDEQGDRYAHEAFIEAYQHKYPGAHMCRHWFTMYLITHTNLYRNKDFGAIARLRGDSSEESFIDYLHDHYDDIGLCQKTNYELQRNVIERIIKKEKMHI